ncbi:MAG: prepilin-type N-terminal cleavage/methylation domain-containing protein [Verrucomicrobiota bacterium JB024]|nr:prepilin-type N-terminal cleavage/methylation domain-containing protein [Verrucomicrobiota bacterium JB024]
MKNRLPHQRTGTSSAFTLIECLVAIVVILIVVSIAVPAINGVIERSRTVSCQQNLRQQYIAFNTFAAENQNRWPARVAFNDDGNVQGNYVYFIREYLPAANNYGRCIGNLGKVYICPEVEDLREYTAGTSYGINGNLFESFSGPTLIRVDGIAVPPRTILLGDGCWIGNQFTSWIDQTRLPGRTFPESNPSPSMHTQGGANLLFCDGHVEYWPDTSILTQRQYLDGGPKDVWTLK